MDAELMTPTENSPALLEAHAMMQQTMVLMQGMADMLRATNERMAALEQQVRMLEKVTPAQAAELNRSIRDRAAEICEDYRVQGMEKQAAALIRKAVRLSTGAHSVREIARCDYAPIQAMVAVWDDYKAMKGLKKGALHESR